MAKFYSVYCPYCFKLLKTNNIVFKTPGSYSNDPYKMLFYEQNGYTSKSCIFAHQDPADVAKKDIVKDVDSHKKKHISGVVSGNGILYETKLCPYCHNQLPNTFATNDTRYIAVIGLPSSGKTAYLSALNTSMSKHNVCMWIDQSIEANKPLNMMSKNYLDNPDNVAIASQNLMGPFFYGLGTAGGEKTVNTIFFDVPGEYYKDPSKISQQLKRFLIAADGIVFVINAAQHLESDNIVQEGDVFNDNSGVLKIIGAFAEAGVIGKKNVAILFNKLDKVFKVSPDFESSYMIRTDNEKIDSIDIKTKSDAIEMLLLDDPRVDDTIKQIVTKISNVFGDNYRLFASSLVREKESKRFSYQCAETPFLWLLSETNAFPKKTDVGR